MTCLIYVCKINLKSQWQKSPEILAPVISFDMQVVTYDINKMKIVKAKFMNQVNSVKMWTRAAHKVIMTSSESSVHVNASHFSRKNKRVVVGFL